jgi:hypothetical protein
MGGPAIDSNHFAAPSRFAQQQRLRLLVPMI